MNHPVEYLHQTSFGIGILGVLVLVFGVACSLFSLFSAGLWRGPALGVW